jgi:hypothetical protein
VFGRDSKQATTPTAEPEVGVEVRPGGKGRPTPSRREAEKRNRTPLIGAPPPAKGATKEERKAARAARTAHNREERMKARAAMATGDERFLPPRDKGPARRFVRDYVDARRNPGEYLLFFLLGALVIQAMPWRNVSVAGLLLMYGLVIVIAVDSFLLRRRMIRLVTEKFGADQAKGVGGYAIMRAVQFRRGRMPAPQVQRGQFPR